MVLTNFKKTNQMKKLERKHITPYRDYGLNFVMTTDYREDFASCDDWGADIADFKKGSIWTYAGEVDKDLYIPIGEGDLSRVFRKGSTYISIDDNGIKPILRPLSDLTKEIEINGDRFRPIEKLYGGDYYTKGMNDSISNYQHLKNHYGFYSQLFEWHFDVFGLIDAGLAVDLNTL